jgi:hypothetical protein
MKEGYWELFLRTGLPEAYLLYKRDEEEEA